MGSPSLLHETDLNGFGEGRYRVMFTGYQPRVETKHTGTLSFFSRQKGLKVLTGPVGAVIDSRWHSF